MSKVRAAITGIAGAVPDYILTNEELSRMVDTSDEWIMTRIGIKERHILKEPGKGSSDLGAAAVKKLLEKTNTKPEEIELVVCATVTPDHQFPATSSIISDKVGIKNAFHFDLNAGCSGFLYGLATVTAYIESGRVKKAILVGAEKMSSIVDYTDRTTCPIFGDGSGAALIEATEDDFGIMDIKLESNGVGRIHLYQKAGGSVWPSSAETVANREHFIYQEGQPVFKWAVSKMADTAVDVMERNGLTPETLHWLVPHQANLRIIEATGSRMKLPKEKVMVNIHKYGNTTAATLPLCLLDYEKQLKKGDNLILATFGAGFTWGAIYVKWAYDTK
ncbi:MAG: beta-ketoacyl-ACP synthase III [Bacteroidales bacterium]|jgi:3-oxoacyl-[acyl-carrier-protein] synthase-3|nr:beta-ketoacyl-ACP synthase III [Bacteroidales bacterium]